MVTASQCHKTVRMLDLNKKPIQTQTVWTNSLTYCLPRATDFFKMQRIIGVNKGVANRKVHAATNSAVSAESENNYRHSTLGQSASTLRHISIACTVPLKICSSAPYNALAPRERHASQPPLAYPSPS